MMHLRKPLKLKEIQEPKLKYLLNILAQDGLNLELGINEPQLSEKLAAKFDCYKPRTPMSWLHILYHDQLTTPSETLDHICEGTLKQKRITMLGALRDFIYLGGYLEKIQNLDEAKASHVFIEALETNYHNEKLIDKSQKETLKQNDLGITYLVTLLPELPSFNVNASCYLFVENRFVSPLEYALGHNSTRVVAPLEIIQGLLNSPELGFYHYDYDLYQILRETNHYDAIKLLIDHGIHMDESDTTLAWPEQKKSPTTPHLSFDTVQLLLDFPGDLSYRILLKIFGSTLDVMGRIGIVNDLIFAQMLKGLLTILKTQENEHKNDLSKQLEAKLEKLFRLNADSQQRKVLVSTFVAPVVDFAKNLTEAKTLGEIIESHFEATLKDSKFPPYALLTDKHRLANSPAPQTALEYYISTDRILDAQILLMYASVREQESTELNAIKKAIYYKKLKGLYTLITQVDIKDPVVIFLYAMDPKNYQNPQNQFAVLTVLLKRMEIRHAISDPAYIAILKDYFYKLPKQSLHVLFKFLRPSIPFMVEGFHQWYLNLFKQDALTNDNHQLRQALFNYVEMNHPLPKPYSIILSNWMYAYYLHQKQLRCTESKEAKPNFFTTEDYELVASNQYWFAEHFNRQGQEFKVTACQLYHRSAYNLMSIKSLSLNAFDFIHPIYYLRRAIREDLTSSKAKVNLFKSLFKLLHKWFNHFGAQTGNLPITMYEAKNDVQRAFECFHESKVGDSEWRRILQCSFIVSKILANPLSKPDLAEILYIALSSFEQIKEPTEQDKRIAYRFKNSFSFYLSASRPPMTTHFISLYQKSISLIEELKLSDEASLSMLLENKMVLFKIYKKFSLKKTEELIILVQEVITIIGNLIKDTSILTPKLNSILLHCYDELCALYYIQTPLDQNKFYDSLTKKIALLERDPSNNGKLASAYAMMGNFFKTSDHQKTKKYLLNAIKMLDPKTLAGVDLANYIEWVLAFSDFYSKKLLAETQDQTLRLTEIFKITRHTMIQQSMGEVYPPLNIQIHQHLIQVLNNLTSFVKPDNHAKLRLAKLHCSLGDCLLKAKKFIEASFQYEKSLEIILTIHKWAIREDLGEYSSIQDKLCSMFLHKFILNFYESEYKDTNDVFSDRIISKAYEFSQACYNEINYLFKKQNNYSVARQNELYKFKCICEFYLTALAYTLNDLVTAQKHAVAFQTTYNLLSKKTNAIDQCHSQFFNFTVLQEMITNFLNSVAPTIKPDPVILSLPNNEFTLEDEPTIELKLEPTPEELERINREEEQKRVFAEEEERKKIAQEIANERMILKNQLSESISTLRKIKNLVIDKLVEIKNNFPKRLEMILGRNNSEDKELANNLSLELAEYEESLANLETYLSTVSEVKTDDLDKLHQTLEKITGFITDSRILLDESLPDFNLKTKDAAAPKDEIKRVNRTELVRASNQIRQDKKKERKTQLEELKNIEKLKREQHKLNRQRLAEESKRLVLQNTSPVVLVELKKDPISNQQTSDMASFWERAISTVVNMQQLLEISRESRRAAVVALPEIPGNKEMIIHFALLYNLLQFSRFRYRKNDAERDQLVDLRNMLIHHGAFQLADFKVYGQTVLDAAHSFCPSLRADIEVYFNKRKGFVPAHVKDKEIQFELHQLSTKGSFPDVELVNFLQNFHLEDKSVTSYSDMTERDRKSKVWTLIPYIQSIYQVLKEAKELSESNELQIRFMPHIQALKMLFTLCGEIHPIPKSRLECKNDYIRFCARCKVIRNWEAHEFKEFALKDVLKTAEMVEQWKPRRMKAPKPILIVPPGFTYANPAVMFSPAAAAGAGPGPDQSRLLNITYNHVHFS